MIKRTFIHLSMIFLFALMQMGAATHAISHLSDGHEDQQQDQSDNKHECGQCITQSHVADANLTSTFDFAVTPVEHILIAGLLTTASTTTSFSYSVRAPPYFSQA